jgi:hypothetical protein
MRHKLFEGATRSSTAFPLRFALAIAPPSTPEIGSTASARANRDGKIPQGPARACPHQKMFRAANEGTGSPTGANGIPWP